MPIDTHNLKIKLGQLEEYIEDVKKLRTKEEADFSPRSDALTLAERRIEKACQSVLDIANHIIAEEGLGQAVMYRELGYILAKEKIITDELARKMEEIAKFRNRLVHEYANLDAKIIYEIVHKHIDDLAEFAKQIYNYLKVKEKGFALIFIIIAVVVLVSAIAGAFYLGKQTNKSANISQITTPASPTAPVLTQSPTAFPTSDSKIDETANWKTYTNSTYKYSFKYPADYFRYKESDSDMGVYLAPREGRSEAKGSPGGLFLDDIWLEANEQSGANLKSFEDFFNFLPGNEVYQKAKKEKIVTNGLSGYKVTRDNPYGPQRIVNYEALFLKESTIFRISLSSYKPGILKNNEKLFDQILSTFRFAD